MKTRTLLWGFILTLLLSLVGCGGGGGGATPTTSSTPTTTNPTPVSNPVSTPVKKPTPTKKPIPTPTPGAVYTIIGKVSGKIIAGITITSTPGGVSATTKKNGSYTLPNLPDGTYTVTPSYVPLIFTPSNKVVTVKDANVTGVDFSNPLPWLKVGSLTYGCYEAVCQDDLATGTITAPIVLGNAIALHIVSLPFPNSNEIMFEGANIGGIMISSTLPGSQPLGVYLADNLTATCKGFSNGFSYANSTFGDGILTSVDCTPPGGKGTANVFIIKTDGKSGFIQVTDGPGDRESPVAGPVAPSGLTPVLYIENGDIMRQMVNIDVAPIIVGSPTVFEKGVSSHYGNISPNATRTRVAFVKVVKNMPHIFVKNVDGSGKDVDLGEGNNPRWSMEKIGSSDLILYDWAYGSDLHAVSPDGTRRFRVAIPSNLDSPAIVFSPPAN